MHSSEESQSLLLCRPAQATIRQIGEHCELERMELHQKAERSSFQRREPQPRTFDRECRHEIRPRCQPCSSCLPATAESGEGCPFDGSCVRAFDGLRSLLRRLFGTAPKRSEWPYVQRLSSTGAYRPVEWEPWPTDSAKAVAG